MALSVDNTRLRGLPLLRSVAHLVLSGALIGCAGWRGPTQPESPPPVATTAPVEQPAAEPDDARSAFIRSRLPAGGALVKRADGAVGIDHTVQADQGLAQIADAYLDFSTIYAAEDLIKAIREENKIGKSESPPAGTVIHIPEVISAVPKTPAEGRLGWTDTDGLRGVYVRGIMASRRGFLPMLDQMAARGMNLIVLDVKDANGRITYPSKVPFAAEIKATASPSVRNLSRTIEFAHSRGVRVAMRIVCFADDILSRAHGGEFAVKTTSGRPRYMGWLDPANQTVQQYVLDLAAEAIEAGADEIQLDYVRFPVEGIEDIDFRLRERKLPVKKEVIRNFVRRVHELTQAHNVPLSVDIFGIVAEGVKSDIENLGQDPVLLAPECEALAPMVYPSHYPKGFLGFEAPGDHPELVRVGVSKLVAMIRRAKAEKLAVVRPWIQGMPWHVSHFGPQYMAEQVGYADKAGAVGWMVWNPSQDYTATWQGVPTSRKAAQSRR